MKLITTLCFVILIFLPGTGKCQNYDEAIRKMFSVKDDVDFVSESLSLKFECKYYLSADSLYTYLYKMALKDIDFSKKDISKSSFKTFKGILSWELSLKPKPNAHVYFYNDEIKKELDFELPDKAFAEQTFAYLQKAAIGESIFKNNQPAKEIKDDADEICNATINFINNLDKTDFSQILGEVESTNKSGIKYYISKTPFPKAYRTIIDDGSVLTNYNRGLIADFMKETRSDKNISQAMENYYKELCNIMENCLVPKKYEKIKLNPTASSFYKMETGYDSSRPIRTSGFANLPRTIRLIVRVVIFQTQAKDGSFENTLSIKIDKR